MLKLVQAILLLALMVNSVTASEPCSKTYKDTHKILSKMDDVQSREEVAKLFQIGDERIADLICALDDKDQYLSLRAQHIIRYLGNAEGMKGLYQSYLKGEHLFSGAIPIPLSEWDYDFIARSYLSEHPNAWHMREFIYALALDGSPRASTTLEEILDRFSDHNNFNVEEIRSQFAGNKEVAQLVLEKAFFLSDEDKRYTTPRLISFNGAKDKALIEIYVNRGVLMEEWYHVVVVRSGQGWKFFSITFVAQS